MDGLRDRGVMNIVEEEEDANDQVEVVVSRPLATITTTIWKSSVYSRVSRTINTYTNRDSDEELNTKQ